MVCSYLLLAALSAEVQDTLLLHTTTHSHAALQRPSGCTVMHAPLQDVETS
jgi:hypothetical protein